MTGEQGASATQRARGRQARADEERAVIEAAMTQLLALPRADTTSWPSVSELARAAGVKRWVLTHKHTDLKDRLLAEVQRLKATPASMPAPQRISRQQILQNEIARLRHENAELHKLVTFHALALNAVGKKYHALAARRDAASNVIPLPVRPLRINSSHHHREDVTAEKQSTTRTDDTEER